MYFSGSWNYNAFTTDITGFEWGVMPSPVGSVSGSAILGGSGLAVPENSANKDLALSFIKWFYEEENFSYYLDLDKGLSSLTGVTYPARRREGCRGLHGPAGGSRPDDYPVQRGRILHVEKLSGQ